ncbi:DEAD-domain-containing protein [Microstroma glucosiphilum]|uniref:RNA helicase n=1 Tax=Pseudomicrostroma glucosiphilum TaxID=1684307 RepID=A0A316UET7_9BASI|nr:DEAD-domain-containing protein [Pseudomicrostroma glucosiphilum]PWN23438.1 DEAD-domain-containing protein [Pseudomicrostroma glucosiphilum]
MPTATKRQSLGGGGGANGSTSSPSASKAASSSKRKANDDDFIMTLDSDDEDAAATTSADVAGPSSNGRAASVDLEEKASPPPPVSAPTAKPKAQLGKREKIIDGKGKGRAPSTFDPSAAGDELALDKAFSFDVEEEEGGHNGWNFNVKQGGVEDGRITVDDIIERKRKDRGDEGLQFSDDEDEDEAGEPEWTGFGEEEEEEADEPDEDALGVTDGDDDEDGIDEFGGGVKLASESDDDSEDEDEDEDDESDDEEDVESAYDSGSDEESDQETAVDKARKAAYFASESDLQANGKPKKEGEDEEVTSSFQSFSLARPLLRALADLSFATPTPIQSRTIPIALAGKDIVAGAVTGSGKTAAFMLPILERLAHRPRGQSEAKTRVVVLTPTRELAVQCWNVGKALGKYTDVRFCLCVGGLSLKSQEQELKLRPEVVIATPGRLIDHIRNSASFGIEDIEILVMDEADRMLEEGFAAELNEIIQSTPRGRQTMLFSATMTDDVDELVRLSLKRPVRLFVDPKRTTATKLIQEFVRVRGATGGGPDGEEVRQPNSKRTEDEARPALLLSLCLRTFRHQVIVFLRSKKLAHQLKVLFGLMGLSAGELHGDLSQEQRLHALQSFKDGRVDFLLATDLASRGLDIKGVQTVINYDMPAQFEIYIHRVGRTARAGNNGRAVTLVGEQDRRLLKTVLKSSPAEQIKHRLIPVEVVASVRDRIESLKGDVEEVMKEEREEKALRQAEMELKKGTNMIEHRDEIMSRPKRTWFQTEKDKEANKNLSASEYRNKVDPASASQKRKEDRQASSSSSAAKHDRFSGLSRKQKRTKMAKEELAAEEKGSGMGRGAIEAGIRSAKKAARPKELGIPEPRKGTKVAKEGAGKKKKRSSSAALKVGKKGGGFSRDFSERGEGGGAGKRSSGGSGGAGRGGGSGGKSRGSPVKRGGKGGGRR